MKRRWTMTIALAALGSANLLYASPPIIRDDAMGLSKTSVFDEPSPAVFAYSDKAPNKSGVLPRAYDGAPPQIPHAIDAYLPIKANENACLDCHDKPSMMEKMMKALPAPMPSMAGKIMKGTPTAMPESHYIKVDGKWQRNSNRYVCTQCHVPQANVKDLVGNTFKSQ